MLALRQLAVVVPKTMVVRSFAAAAQANDPIQKLFVDKIREYSAKAKSASNGLVDANAEVAKKLQEDMDRVGNVYGVKSDKDIANLGLKFEETTHLDSINMAPRK
ncbi:ATP synthesis coupled proton transport [Tyrophagus putrescentiae]|nr:ATP synthesis coupled proton transport [Tyrophagus putrescentiae]